MIFVKPRPLMVILTLLGIAFFLKLGFWQLSRAAEKERLLAEFRVGNQVSEQSLAKALVQLRSQRFARTAIRGKFLPVPTILLDSQREGGKIGVAIFNAFQAYSEPGENPLAQLPVMLVARGFMPIAPDRSAFPTPEIPLGDIYLTGMLAPPPSSGIRLSMDTLSALDSNRLLATRIETDALALKFALPLLPQVLQLDAKSPYGYVRNWKPATFGPEKHRGYALTWFGLALTVLIVFLILHRPERKQP